MSRYHSIHTHTRPNERHRRYIQNVPARQCTERERPPCTIDVPQYSYDTIRPSKACRDNSNRPARRDWHTRAYCNLNRTFLNSTARPNILRGVRHCARDTQRGLVPRHSARQGIRQSYRHEVETPWLVVVECFGRKRPFALVALVAWEKPTTLGIE